MLIKEKTRKSIKMQRKNNTLTPITLIQLLLWIKKCLLLANLFE